MSHDAEMNAARNKVRDAMSIMGDSTGPIGGGLFWAILDGNADTWSNMDIKRFKKASKELRVMLRSATKILNEALAKFDEVDKIPDGD